MRAIVIKDGKLELADLPRLPLSATDVRVSVRAAGVNRADLMQRMGMYPAPPDVAAAVRDVPGLELAGVVESVGAAVRDVKEGDRVFAIVGGGAYAEEVVLNARLVAKIPDGISFEQAAAIPEAFVTAYDAMVEQGGLAAGDTVLVHAVGSGVGTAAVQIAVAIGAQVVGTARTKEKLGPAGELGMRAGIVPGEGTKFADQVRAETGGRGVDVVLDLVGGAYTAESLSCLVEKGRLILVGLMAGTNADVDLGLVLRKRLRVFGTVLRARPLEEKILAANVLARRIAPLVAAGKVRAVVDKTFPLERAADAQSYMASNAGFGKVVLTT